MSNIAKVRREGRLRRHRRVRKKIHGTAERPRLAVHRTNKHFNLQLIDDEAGRTVAAASSVEADMRSSSGATVSAAAQVGKLLAQRAKAAGVEECYFDRGGFLFHGKIKALADAAREGGLKF